MDCLWYVTLADLFIKIDISKEYLSCINMYGGFKGVCRRFRMFRKMIPITLTQSCSYVLFVIKISFCEDAKKYCDCLGMFLYIEPNEYLPVFLLL